MLPVAESPDSQPILLVSETRPTSTSATSPGWTLPAPTRTQGTNPWAVVSVYGTATGSVIPDRDRLTPLERRQPWRCVGGDDGSGAPASAATPALPQPCFTSLRGGRAPARLMAHASPYGAGELEDQPATRPG